jgi:hypothetical protein
MDGSIWVIIDDNDTNASGKSFVGRPRIMLKSIGSKAGDRSICRAIKEDDFDAIARDCLQPTTFPDRVAEDPQEVCKSTLLADTSTHRVPHRRGSEHPGRSNNPKRHKTVWSYCQSSVAKACGCCCGALRCCCRVVMVAIRTPPKPWDETTGG